MVGNMPEIEARKLIRKLKPVSSTVLELAATVHWLASVEKVPDWKTEVVRRKSEKTKQGRLAQSVELLRNLDLAPTNM